MVTAPLVLIVDDDVDTREMYAWCLEVRGFRVALAATATAAAERAAAEPPDVLVTDYTLPGGDGFALADSLRQAPATKDIAMLLVSGREFAGEARIRASRLFDRVLLKPVLPDHLVGEITPLLSRQQVRSPAPIARPEAV